MGTLRHWPSEGRSGRTLLVVLALLATVTAAGCMATNVANLAETEASAGNDESTLWKQADAMSALMRDSNYILVEPDLDAYLEGIADRLLESRMAGLDERVRVGLLRTPEINAFALPNGDIYLMTGLVSKLSRENQLAAIIGHEIAHVYERHSLRTYRKLRNNRRMTAFGAATLGAAAGGGANLVTALAAAAGNYWAEIMISGYSREFEHRSDELSVVWLHDAHYDPHASADAFEILLDASKDEGREDPYMWHSTHPKLRERVKRSRAQAVALASHSTVPTVSEPMFSELVAFTTVENARALVLTGDYEKAEKELAKLAKGSQRVRTDADAEFIRGEIASHRDGDKDVDAAIAAYKRAVAIDPTHASAYLEMGLLARSAKRDRTAADALRRYTVLAPDAPDRSIIDSYIEDLEK